MIAKKKPVFVFHFDTLPQARTSYNNYKMHETSLYFLKCKGIHFHEDYATEKLTHSDTNHCSHKLYAPTLRSFLIFRISGVGNCVGEGKGVGD